MSDTLRRRWPWAVVLVLAVAAGVVALVVKTGSDEPPDVTTVAYSGDVTTADQSAVARVETKLTGVVADARWLEPLGDEVSDRCFTRPPDEGDWAPLQCVRTVIRFFGSDRDLTDLNPALTRDGWHALDPEASRNTTHDARTRQELVVAWAQRPQPLQPISELDRQRLPHDPVAVYREARALDLKALSTAAFQHHKYVLALGVTDTYYSSSQG